MPLKYVFVICHSKFTRLDTFSCVSNLTHISEDAVFLVFVGGGDCLEANIQHVAQRIFDSSPHVRNTVQLAAFRSIWKIAGLGAVFSSFFANPALIFLKQLRQMIFSRAKLWSIKKQSKISGKRIKKHTKKRKFYLNLGEKCHCKFI